MFPSPIFTRNPYQSSPQGLKSHPPASASANYPHPTAIMQEDAPYFDKAVIRPPTEEDKVSRRRYYRFIVDSRDRNRSRYPTPSQYEVKLPEDIQDVCFAKLLLADIPFSRYLIHSGNNKLHLFTSIPAKDATTGELLFPALGTYSITLTPSDYTPSELATEIETQLNTLGLGTFDVSYEAKTDKFYFSSNLLSSASAATPFQLLFEGDMKPYGPQFTEKRPVIDAYGNPTRNPDGSIVYQDVRVGETTITYRQNSVGPLIGFTTQDATSLGTGRVTLTAGSKIVVGSGTAFTSELRPDDFLVTVTYNGGGAPIASQRVEVDHIVSDTEFHIKANSTINQTLATFFLPRITAPYRRDFEAETRYLIMRLDRAELVHSINSPTENAFAIINNNVNSMNNEYDTTNVKTFDPPLNVLSTLRISFYDYNGNLYDFQNKEHRFELLLCMMRNVHKTLGTGGS